MQLLAPRVSNPFLCPQTSILLCFISSQRNYSANSIQVISCGSDGGAEGVVYLKTTAGYNTAAYLASGYTPGGILIKVVYSGA